MAWKRQRVEWSESAIADLLDVAVLARAGSATAIERAVSLYADKGFGDALEPLTKGPFRGLSRLKPANTVDCRVIFKVLPRLALVRVWHVRPPLNARQSAAAIERAAARIDQDGDDWANELPLPSDLYAMKQADRDMREGRLIPHAAVVRRLKRILRKRELEAAAGILPAAPPINADPDDWADEPFGLGDAHAAKVGERDAREGRLVPAALVRRRLKRFIAKLQRAPAVEAT